MPIKMKASNSCIELIKQFEGFKSKPYLCPAKVPTIGYGSTYYADGTKVKLTDPAITEEQGKELLFNTLKQYVDAVNKYVNVELTQNQFDALVDFAYNAGTGALQKSTLLKILNENKIDEASLEFGKWVKAGGKVLKGLVNRREKEKALFLKK